MACVQQAAKLLAALETLLSHGLVLAHLNGDAELLRRPDRKLTPVSAHPRKIAAQAG